MELAPLRRLIRSRHLAWLLALALWLPAAQWAAATHALLHLHAAVTDRGDPPAHLPSSCDTCVVAAALGGAAPAAVAPSVAAAALPAARPSTPLPASFVRLHVAAYRSRAPPLPAA